MYSLFVAKIIVWTTRFLCMNSYTYKTIAGRTDILHTYILGLQKGDSMGKGPEQDKTLQYPRVCSALVTIIKRSSTEKSLKMEERMTKILHSRGVEDKIKKNRGQNIRRKD
jgi:hypothetical protein